MRASIAPHVDGITKKILGMRNADLRGAFAASKKPARTDQRDHKKKQEGPDGPWPARAARTKARLGQRSRKRARKLLGRLPNALELKSSRRSLIVRSRVAWSDAHQRGRRVGKGTRLPKRVFLWASKPLLKQVAEFIEFAVAKYWDKV